jgi:hypothetical protein
MNRRLHSLVSIEQITGIGETFLAPIPFILGSMQIRRKDAKYITDRAD